MKVNVLAVDDSDQNLYLLRVLLEGNGYVVEVANNGSDALEKARHHPPDVIISDILMPVMDGFSLCREWQNDERLKEIPFVFYTATYTDTKDEEFALSLGAERFIVKPTEPDVFINELRQVLQNAEDGRLRAPDTVSQEEPVYLKTYSERLVRKLETKAMELEHAHSRMNALYRATTALAAIRPPGELVPHILRIIVEYMEFDKACYYNFDAERGEFRLTEAVGFPEELVDKYRQELVFRTGEQRGLVGLVGQTRQPMVVSDTQDESRWIALSDGIRSTLFVPVSHKDNLFGIAQFLSTEPGYFGPDDARNAMTLANNIGIAIENARLVDRLARSEARYRRMAENAPDIIYRYRLQPSHSLEYISPAVTTIVGYTPEELYNVPEVGSLLVYSDDQPLLATLFRGECKFGEPVIMRLISKDGTLLWTEQHNVPIYDETGQLIALEGIARDVNKRLKNEEALRESESRLRQAQQLAGLGYWDWDMDNGVLHWSEQVFRIFGQDPQTFKPTIEAFEGCIHPDDLHAFFSQRRQALLQSSQLNIEHRIIRPDGTLRYVHELAESIHDGRNNVSRMMGTVQDITERKHMEEQAQQQQRLAAVGQLAAGIAHDFNNLLTPIIGYAELLRSKRDISIETGLANIIQQGHRAAQLTRQILDFSRQSIREPHPLDLKAHLEESIAFVERTIPENIRIKLDIEPADHIVNADATQLQQVLTNLAVNARDAMPGGGKLTFRLYQLWINPGDTPPRQGMLPGAWTALAVSDTGSGIAPDVLPRIFEPFFTTKVAGEGSGLGLAQVYGIVKQHEGDVVVESTLGHGTTFTVYLPTLSVEPQPVEANRTHTIPFGMGETILLVEDNPVVRDIVTTALESLNYRILAASNGEEGLSVFHEHQEVIDLVLTDAMMPRMDGYALVRALHSEDPTIKMLMMSGYPQGEDLGTESECNILGWLNKPPSIQQMAQMLRQALD